MGLPLKFQTIIRSHISNKSPNSITPSFPRTMKVPAKSARNGI